jgi:hypothetical protein
MSINKIIKNIKNLNSHRIICLNNRFCELMKYETDLIFYNEENQTCKIDGYGKEVVLNHVTFNDLADTAERVAQVVKDNYSSFEDIFKI